MLQLGGWFDTHQGTQGLTIEPITNGIIVEGGLCNNIPYDLGINTEPQWN